MNQKIPHQVQEATTKAAPTEESLVARRLRRRAATTSIVVEQLTPFPLHSESIDPNPQLGAFPLCNIFRGTTPDGYLAFTAEVTPEFIKQHVIPRGRPHFAGLHAMILNDALAVTLYAHWRSEPYGVEYRIVETDARFEFFRERFMRNSIVLGGTSHREVDSWKVALKIVPRGSAEASDRLGLAIIEYLGVDNDSEILLARSEVQYIRRDAVKRRNS